MSDDSNRLTQEEVVEIIAETVTETVKDIQDIMLTGPTPPGTRGHCRTPINLPTTPASDYSPAASPNTYRRAWGKAYPMPKKSKK